MSKISFELLESEWIKYNGYKNFLKFKEKSFGDDINQKFLFKDDKLLKIKIKFLMTQINEKVWHS